MVCFDHQNHVILFSHIENNNSAEKNMNIQKALFFPFLRKTKPTKQKKLLTLVI